MPAQVTIVVGPPRSGKTQRLLATYRQAASGSLRRLWLAPSHGAVDELRDALAASAEGALLDPGITTFAGFAEDLVAAGPRPVRPLSRLQKRALLRQVVEQSLGAGELSYLKSVAGTPGFLAQLDEWIAERKRGDVWAEDFARQASGPRDRELTVLYRRYQRRLLEDNLYDAEGRFWAARDVFQDNWLQQNSLREPVEYALVVVAGFSDFTAAQFDILRLLAERAAEVRFALTADPDCLSPNDVKSGRALLFSRVHATFNRLRELLPELTLETTQPSRSDGSLLRLDQNLFREDALLVGRPGPATHTSHESHTSHTPPAETIAIIAASSEQREIAEIARRIKSALHAQRARPQDFLVVFPHLREAAGRVDDVFEDFGIPRWIETRPRLASSPLVRALSGLLRLEAEDWPFRGLLEVVGNRLFAIFDQSSQSDLRAELETLIRASQIPVGKATLMEQLGTWASDHSPEQHQRTRLAIAGLAGLKQLAAALDQLPTAAPLSKWADTLERLVIELGIDLRDAFSRDWQILRRGLQSLETIAEAPIDLERLLETLELVAADQPLPGATDSLGRVRVLTAESARHTSAPHVFLAGLSEQSLSSAPRVDSLDSERLDAPNGALSDAGDAMYLFYSLVTRATESLTLSYPALDDKGQQLPPSPFVAELKRCLPPDAIRETRLPLGDSTFEDTESLSRSAYRQTAVKQALHKDQRLLAALVSEPAPAGAGIADAILAIASRARRDQFGPFEGLLESDAARVVLARHFDANHLWSPSQLESYATCSFRFFSENLLGLAPLDDLALANDAGRRGRLLHQVLAAIHAQLLEQPANSPTDEAWQVEDSPWRAELAAQFGRALDARVQTSPLDGVEGSLREIERRQIAAWAEDYARQESEYRKRWSHLDEPPRPAHFEVRFGPEVRTGEASSTPGASTPLPFELDLGEEKIRITGQIDRIDVGRVGGVTVLNVIDYKSGRQVQLKDEHLQAGRQLQLPLYALAAEELLFANQGARALAAGYWSIQSQGFEKAALELRRAESKSLSEASLQLRPQVVETVRNLVTGIRAGQFPVFNTDQHCTRWCQFSTICRVAQIRSLEKEWPPTETPTS